MFPVPRFFSPFRSGLSGKIAALFLLAIILQPAAMPAANAQIAPETGMVAGIARHVKGAAELFPNSGRSKLLAPGDRVRVEDRVTTGFNGQVLIQLMDGSVLTLGPNAEVVIDEFVFDNETGKGKAVTSILKGVFRFTSGRISKANPGKSEINLPVGTLGLRGTDLAARTTAEEAHIVLLDPGSAPPGGAVHVQQPGGPVIALTLPRDGIALSKLRMASPGDMKNWSPEKVAGLLGQMGMSLPEHLQGKAGDPSVSETRMAALPDRPVRVRREQCRKAVRNSMRAGQPLPRAVAGQEQASVVVLKPEAWASLDIGATLPDPDNFRLEEGPAKGLLLGGTPLQREEIDRLAGFCLRSFPSLQSSGR